MIKTAREMRGMTQAELAEQSALTVDAIEDIENGSLNFKINSLVRIAGALKFILDINLTPQ